jgi:uncharacterized membrane protein
MDAKSAVLYLVNTLAGTVTAVVVIAGVIAKIRPVGRSVKQFFFRELYESNDRQDRRLDNLELQQLKQIICDRRLPDGERLRAGEEYIRRGGNGEIKMIYESIAESAKKKRMKERERFDEEEQEKRRGE